MREHSDLALEYRHLEEVTSTNDYLREFIPSADVTIVSAAYQTKGRGQKGNTWVSQPGRNLLFSLLVCPEALKAVDGFVLSQAMALSIQDTLSEYVEGISVKWPNDIYCCDRKICGTLIENTLRGKYIGRSVIGSGININQDAFPSGLAAPATSLFMLLGRELDTTEIMHAVVERFRNFYAEILSGQYERIRRRYHDSLYLRGQQHRFSDIGGTFLGTISHVEPDGHLIIIDSAGSSRRYAFKEVRLVHDTEIME